MLGYPIAGAPIAANAAVSAAGPIAADLVLAYVLRQAVTADLQLNYTMRQAVVRDLVVTYRLGPLDGISTATVPPSRTVIFLGGTRLVVF